MGRFRPLGLKGRNWKKLLGLKGLSMYVLRTGYNKFPASFLPRFSFESHLKTQHPDLATSDTQFCNICDICGKSFSSPAFMKAHREVAHPRQQHANKCQYCSEIFPTVKMVYNHMMNDCAKKKVAYSRWANMPAGTAGYQAGWTGCRRVIRRRLMLRSAKTWMWDARSRIIWLRLLTWIWSALWFLGNLGVGPDLGCCNQCLPWVIYFSSYWPMKRHIQGDLPGFPAQFDIFFRLVPSVL